MAQASAELEVSGETTALTHADWLGLLVDRELTHRRDKRLAARLPMPDCATSVPSMLRHSRTISGPSLASSRSTSLHRARAISLSRWPVSRSILMLGP